MHFADKAESCLQLAREPKDFLKNLPGAWDETRFVAGYPGQVVILARRKGDTWYLAGVNGRNQPREERIKPGAWLPPGRCELARIGDGQDARSFAGDTGRFEAGRELTVTMLPHGGCVAALKPGK